MNSNLARFVLIRISSYVLRPRYFHTTNPALRDLMRVAGVTGLAIRSIGSA